VVHGLGRAAPGCGAEPRFRPLARVSVALGRSYSGGWDERDLLAKRHQLTEEVSGPVLFLDATLLEVRARVNKAKRGIPKEVPDSGEDEAGDGDDGPLGATRWNKRR